MWCSLMILARRIHKSFWSFFRWWLATSLFQYHLVSVFIGSFIFACCWFLEREREGEINRLYYRPWDKIWPMIKCETVHKCVDLSNDAWCSRICLMNTAIESAHYDLEKYVWVLDWTENAWREKEKERYIDIF